MTRALAYGLLLLAAACGHTEPFATPPTGSDGPFSDAAPIRLTYNSSTDSAASLTQDGQSLLYLYSAEDGSGDRCIGMLGPAGGSRRWQLCDTRADRADSAKSFSAAAVGEDGRLLYAQALSRRGVGNISRARLWLADTAAPFARREIFSFPANLGGRGISWLVDAQWVAPDAFIARAGWLNAVQNCPGNCPWDTTFVDPGVVRGTITAAGATLAYLPGAEVALYHALAEQGAAVVIIRDASTVRRLALSGGAPVALPPLPTAWAISGLGCRASKCVITQTAARLAPLTGFETRFTLLDLTTASYTLLRIEEGRWAGPVVLPANGDVVAQNSAGLTRDLYLFKGLVPQP